MNDPNDNFNGDYLALLRTDEENTAERTAGFLWRAMKYIIERRPHELITIAILNEKAYDVYDAMDGARRAKQIN
jgi:hypothetical protein